MDAQVDLIGHETRRSEFNMNRTDWKQSEWSIIAVDKFIQATRDSGYKGTASAVSELVDNSIQAGATRIRIDVRSAETGKGLEISVCDNGCGMDPFTLRHALRFGGSSRFNDRAGLGRFGMGLPNSSLSQARRVTVYTWQKFDQCLSQLRDKKNNIAGNGATFATYLDVDEIITGELVDVPRPKRIAVPPVMRPGKSGTVVVWSCCDRLDYRRISTICRKLHAELSQRFRYFLWKGIKITINGERVEPFDPLFLHSNSKHNSAKAYGNEILYEISANPEDTAAPSGTVRVRFAELPVQRWANLSNDEKRSRGITKRAGTSIIRAGREVDYGWFFFGSKRRENYDDWWRCEVTFDPILDEAFGLTHTKQQIRPQQYLLDALTPDIEATARVLNAHARKTHTLVKSEVIASKSETLASERDRFLSPLISSADTRPKKIFKDLQRDISALKKRSRSELGNTTYKIIEAPLRDMCFYGFSVSKKQFVLVLDPGHPFYREIYKPLLDANDKDSELLRMKLELLLLAAARTEAASPKAQQSTLAAYRYNWSNTFETFIGG